MQPITLLAFALGAYAGCTGVSKDAGYLTALCTDEDTGMEFMYADLENHLETTIGAPHHEMADHMYNAYHVGRGNQSEKTLETRSLTTFWNECYDKVSGVCANDNVIGWAGNLASFTTALAAVVASVDHKLNTSPRSQCTNYANKGTICVSWAAYYASAMSQQQIQDIANECANVCEQQNNSCEARVVTDNTVEYFCVSNRATSCSANGQIRAC